MNVAKHVALGAAAGAVAAVLPDIALATYYGRSRWLAEHELPVRAHRALHTYRAAIVAAVFVGWCTHVWADRRSPHRTRETR